MKMSRLLAAALLLLVVIAGCGRGPGENENFTGLAERCLSGLRSQEPAWATSLGDHRFDDELGDFSAAGFQARRDFCASYLDSLGGIDEGKLDEVNRIDLLTLRNYLEGRHFQLKEIREYEWNPLVYNVGDAIYVLLARDFAPLRDRLISLRSRLEGIPAVLDAARANLKRPALVHTETAVLQNRGNISLIMDDLKGFLDREPDLIPELRDARAKAIAALQQYGDWLENDLLPRADGEFRLGEDRVRRTLRHTLDSELSIEDILATAEQDLETTRALMLETAKPLYAGFFPERMQIEPAPDSHEIISAVLDRLAEDRPDNANIVQRAEADLRACTDFVREKDLVTLPEHPVSVIVMPEFQRGEAIAYCDPPGPLDEGLSTYFAIAPTPADWPSERADSFFREYNDYMLKDLTIHEAMPGHYLQLSHANAFEAPTLTRAMLSSGVFVEGWATYSEQLMAEFGFGGPEVKMQMLKMRLRLIINAIIDQKIHCAGMTRDEAIDLMMNEGFQEEGEAHGKWRRACMSSTQLSTYYVGNIEINRIRTDCEAKRGGDFELKAFHDELLSYGSPAPHHLRKLMGL